MKDFMRGVYASGAFAMAFLLGAGLWKVGYFWQCLAFTFCAIWFLGCVLFALLEDTDL